jgi:D-inositol-3-phosphate glycosyltransferase
MKILHISFHTAPFGNIGKNDSGGLNVYVANISNELSKYNEVTVITAENADSFTKGNLEFLSFNLFDKDLPVEEKEIYLQEFLDKIRDTYDLMSFDLIHAHYWLSGLVGRKLSNEFNKPFVYTSHSLGVFLEGYNKERVDCEKLIMDSSNKVTVSSTYEKTAILENYKIEPSKLELITPGVNKEIFTPDLEVKRENIFLSIGRIQEQKGQIKILKFLDNFRKINNDFLCYFVGGPSGKLGNEYLEELKSFVSEMNLNSNVEFLGSLPQSNIKKLMNKSKLLIHASTFETFGLIAIEANSMGVPVLTINEGSLSEIIENNINGYISENLVDAGVNRYVHKILNDSKKYEEIMFSCIEKSKDFDWVYTVEKIEKIYKSF